MAEGPSLAEQCTKMDKFLGEFAHSSISQKANITGKELVKFLKENQEAINNYGEISLFVDGLGVHWVANQNPKVSLYGFDALVLIAEAMQTKYKLHGVLILHHVTTKLGDSRDYLREKARAYILKTNEIGGISTNYLLEKMTPLLSNKNKDMAAEAQKVILDLVMMSKAKKISNVVLNELLQVEIACLTTNLREDPLPIFLDIAERLGKVRTLEVLGSYSCLPHSSQQKKIIAVMKEVRDLQPDQAVSGAHHVGGGEEEDDPDFTLPKIKPIAGGAKAKTRGASGMANKGGLARTGSVRCTEIGKGDKYSLHSGPAGEADEAWFQSAFEDVPEITCINHREFDNILKRIMEDLKSGAEFWERKVEALRKLRSLIKNMPSNEDELQAFIRNIALLLMGSLKDLRSQVVRETCLTFAYICMKLKNKVEAHTCEVIMIQLMNNIISSAKVISSASYIALQFMYTHVNHGRLISSLVQILVTSKSREVRAAACEFLELILHNWPLHRLEQQIPSIQEGIKKGIAESSNDARMAARKAFWAFRGHFPEQGDALLNAMDAICKKNVMAGDPPEGVSLPVAPKPARQQELPTTSTRRPVARPTSSDTPGSRRYTPVPSVRSNSAIDLQAAQRAKVRQQYAALARQKVGCGASLPRSKRVESGAVAGSLVSPPTPERSSRTRSRVGGVSHSQPGSRSGSPSSRQYFTPGIYAVPEYHGRGRSQGTSRETSPSRFGSQKNLSINYKRRGFLGDRQGDKPFLLPTARPILAQRMLAQSLEAENVPLANSLYDGELPDSAGHKVSPLKTSYRPYEDHSDDSDASSLCSERSFDSYRRTSDDIMEIIRSCESTHWSDRKEGLMSLQKHLHSGNTLNPTDLKRITDIFTRMFNDVHTKVFSLFLDALNELIHVHRSDLNSWLYVLLTRLLNKLGTDLLGSIQNKILRSLDVVRESFPPELQMTSVLRFLTDPTQTPNLRVKTATLNYITRLAPITDPLQAFPSPTPAPTRDPVQAALHKLIGWSMGDSIKQGVELRRAAQDAILALFNLNTPQITLRLAQLPQEYQEAASTILKGRVRSSSSSSAGGAPSHSPPSPAMSPRAQYQHARFQEGGDSVNSEEIFRVLRKTTAEIQNYSSNYSYEAGSEKPPDKDNTTSKDSGISQLSGTEALEEGMEELSIQSSSSSTATTTTLTNRVLTVRDCNGVDATDNTQQDDRPIDEHEAMRKVVEALKSPPDSDNGENISIVSESEKRASLAQLARLIRESSVTVLQENFKPLLRILLGNLTADSNNRDVQTRILVLTALTELIRKRAMTEYFNHYVELLILKVLNSYRDTSKEVVRSAEVCANTIAITLSPVMVIRVLAPLIQTGEYPLNLAAVKMLTKLVDACGREPVLNYLPDLMPGLIQAYDNQESSVRKSAVFCMVSLHGAIGEEDLKPHLAALNGSKLKLLHLYIRRSQQGSSAPTSPRNHPPPSS